MAAHLGLTDDGTRVLITGPCTDDDRLRSCWPPFGLSAPRAVDVDEPADVVIPLAPDTLDAEGPTEQTWVRLESDLALTAADHLTDRAVVHAGLVTWQGRSVLLPGPSRAGKSTLVLALADLGATVLTDEFVLLDPLTGAATGWPRPVHRRRADGGTDRIAVAPRAADPAGPVPVDLVAVLGFDRDHGERRWASLRPGDVVTSLVGNTVNARRQPDRTFDAAVAVARTAAGVGGRRGEAVDAAAALLGLLDDGR